MTDEIATKKARELAAASAEAEGFEATARSCRSGDYDDHWPMIALAKRLREVSDAVEVWDNAGTGLSYEEGMALRDSLVRFILPKPKPDPLIAVAEAVGLGASQTAADELRAALAAQGIDI